MTANLPVPATGRPSTYDRTTADAILMGIAEIEMSLTQACARVSTPTYPEGVPKGTFLGWVVDDVDGLSDRYMRARKIRAHSMLDELVAIADQADDDFVETIGKGGRAKVSFNGEAVARSALRVSARQWVLSRILRDELGDKVTVDAGAGLLAVAGAAERLAAKLGGLGAPAGAETPAVGAAPVGKPD
jgi:hypothetical protein